MASRVSSSVTTLFLLLTATLLVVHATARNLQQTQTLPLHAAATPPPNVVEDRKNFIYGAGIGGAAGVGGFLGMPFPVGGGTGMTLPPPTTGSPLLGGSGAFGGGGLGGAIGFPAVPSVGGSVESP